MSAAARYSRGAIFFHWSIALLIMLASGLALFRETFAPVAGEMISFHKAIGLAVLALSIGHLVWRRGHRPPPPVAAVRPWQARAARSTHSLLQIGMVAVPVAGWIFTSAAPVGSPVDYAGWDWVPRLPIERNRATSWFWHEVHELAGFSMIVLFLLHIMAALQHHFLARDGTLSRMLPFMRDPGR